MSIQAVSTGFTRFFLMLTSHVQVHRALLYTTEGTFKPPGTKSGGSFSKVNWGDYEAVSLQGRKSIVKRATVFLNKIQTLKDQQWDDIFKIALENNERVKRVDSGEYSEDNSAVESNDDELLDPLYDEIGHA